MSESVEDRRRRLRHRSKYRGFKEADVIFQTFADQHLDRLSADELDQYEALTEEADHDVVGWVIGNKHAPARHDNAVLAKMRATDFSQV